MLGCVALELELSDELFWLGDDWSKYASVRINNEMRQVALRELRELAIDQAGDASLRKHLQYFICTKNMFKKTNESVG